MRNYMCKACERKPGSYMEPAECIMRRAGAHDSEGCAGKSMPAPADVKFAQSPSSRAQQGSRALRRPWLFAPRSSTPIWIR
jgi:hypothetical protein